MTLLSSDRSLGLGVCGRKHFDQPFLRLEQVVLSDCTNSDFSSHILGSLQLSTIDHKLMKWVVFLRAVNVGGANRCRPAELARQLAKFGVVNIGAVGTFVVREDVSESTLRAAFARKLPFKCEIMICPARDVLNLTSKNPFARQPADENITRFVNVLAKRLSAPPSLPLHLPSSDDWLLKIIAIQDRFVLGLYRRQMKAISYLSKIEKLLGVPATTRSWNTIEKVVEILDKAQKPSHK
jgi:uncharacterized protein (DUF1697 family)